MAAEEQSGGESLLYWGNQSAKESPVKNGPATGDANKPQPYDPANATSAKTREGHIIRARFPFTQLGLDMGGEQLESASIIGRDSASKPAPGQIWGEGPLEFEMILRNMIHILRPSFNSYPTGNTKVDAKQRKVEGVSDDSIPEPTPKSGDTKVLEAKAGSEIRFNKPCRLTFNGLKDKSKLVVIGEKRYGLPDEEVVAITREYTVSGTSYTTDDYFDSWKTATVSGSGEPTINTTVGYDTGVYSTKLEGFGTGLGDGLTVFGRKGLMPFLSTDAYFNNIGITVGDDIRVLVEVLAGTYFNRRLPNTKREEKLEIPTDWQTNSHYPVGDLDFAAAWGSLFQYGDDIVDLTGLTLNINLNLEFRRAYRARRQRGRPRRSSTPRQITITPTTFFEYSTDASEVFLKWQDIYLANETRPCEYHCYNWDDNGREHAMIMKLPACTPNAVVSTTVEDSGDIERPVSLLSVPSNSIPYSNTNLGSELLSNELSVEFITDQYVE